MTLSKTSVFTFCKGQSSGSNEPISASMRFLPRDASRPPGDDPASFYLFRFNLKTKIFTKMNSSTLFGGQYGQRWEMTPDAAALVWVPRGPGGLQARDDHTTYEPRKMYLIDFEHDSYQTLVSLPK